ncbi:hypothetical protein, partial [Escherichia coli]
QVHGGITTLSLLPVIFISNGEVFRMTTETIVCFLFWYMYAGSCSARLHRSLGYGRHYDTAHYILYMTAVMLFWPVTLPAATDIVADRLKKRR